MDEGIQQKRRSCRAKAMRMNGSWSSEITKMIFLDESENRMGREGQSVGYNMQWGSLL